MSELSFLIDLLLNEKLSKSVRTKIAERVKEVEVKFAAPPVFTMGPTLPPPKVINGALQAPSTVAAMERHAAEAPPVVASPVVANALMERERALAAATSGKPEAGRTSPRKF